MTHTEPGVRSDEPIAKKRKVSENLVVSGPRKKGFLGFLVNMKAYEKMFQTYVQTNHLQYILTFKTSQDHVELLFSSIRGSLGKNNNPTTIEFTTNVKKILLGAEHSSRFSNCLLQDDIEMLPVPSSLEETFKLHELSTETTATEVEDYLNSINTNSEYKNDILVYMAGYVQQKIARKEGCLKCKVIISNAKIVQSSLLLNMKNRGPLCIPSEDVVKIIKVSNSVLDRILKGSKIMLEKNIVEKITIETLMILQNLYPRILTELSEHSTDCAIISNHRILMIKKIAALFITTVIHHKCRLNNNKDSKIRSMYSKLILFKNQ